MAGTDFVRRLMFLILAQFDFEIFNAPFSGGFVGVEEYVEAVAAYYSAPVEDFYGFVIIVAGNNHFCAEGVYFVGGNKDVVSSYLVAVGGFTIGKLAATSFAGTVCSDTHHYCLPLAGGVGD